MTTRQKVLKAIYPLFMWFNKKSSTVKTNPEQQSNTTASFYSLKDTMIDGQPFDFSQLKGKKALLVNTASDCGYTGQYEDLQKLYEQFKGELVVIGFPANDFKEQEKGSNEEIASFCKKNYAVDFPLMKKSSVVKTEGQNPVFKWLSNATLNGWNNQEPVWNFSKYLVNEEGRLINYFAPSVSPLDKSVTDAINK
jgi:glutathione peroxidase